MLKKYVVEIEITNRYLIDFEAIDSLDAHHVAAIGAHSYRDQNIISNGFTSYFSTKIISED